MPEEYIYATGKRKSAIARVRLKPGSGKITVNGQAVQGKPRSLYGFEFDAVTVDVVGELKVQIA